MFPIEIGKQAKMDRTPSQFFLGLRARGRAVDTKEVSNPPKMFSCFLGRLSDNGHVQVFPKYAGNFATGYAVIRDTVIDSTRGALLQHQPVEMTSIEPVHSGPTIEAVTDIG